MLDEGRDRRLAPKGFTLEPDVQITREADENGRPLRVLTPSRIHRLLYRHRHPGPPAWLDPIRGSVFQGQVPNPAS